MYAFYYVMVNVIYFFLYARKMSLICITIL